MLIHKLFRRKSLDQLVGATEDPARRLKRALGPVQLTALGVGAAIGAGIFSSIGSAVAGGSGHFGAGPVIFPHWRPMWWMRPKPGCRLLTWLASMLFSICLPF